MGGFGSFLGGMAQVAAAGTQGMVEGEREVRARKEKDRAFKLQEDQFALHKRDSDAAFSRMQSVAKAKAIKTWLDVATPEASDQQQQAGQAMMDAAGGGGGFAQPAAPAPAAQTAWIPAAVPATGKGGKGGGTPGIIQSTLQTGRGSAMNSPSSIIAQAETTKAETHRLKRVFSQAFQNAATDDERAAINDEYDKRVKPLEDKAADLYVQGHQAQYLEDLSNGFSLFTSGDKEGARKYLAPHLPAEMLQRFDQAQRGKVAGLDGWQIKDSTGKVVWQAPDSLTAVMFNPSVPLTERMKTFHEWEVAQQKFGHDEKMLARQAALMNKPTDKEKALTELKKLDKEHKTASPERKKEIESEIWNIKEIHGMNRTERADRKMDDAKERATIDREIKAATAILRDMTASPGDREWALSILHGTAGGGGITQPPAPASGGPPPRDLRALYEGATPVGVRPR